MLLAVCGKSNTGKTSFFSAATLVDAEISSRTFTTIKPNRGISYVRSECPCKELKVKCNPQNSKCINGTRLVPVKLIDIAGLVPDAHLGKGLGNQFLSDIMEADTIIHVVDASGSTDSHGNLVPAGTHDPEEDIIFFEKEIDYWLLDILKRALAKRAPEKDFPLLLQKQLSGLKLSPEAIEHAIKDAKLLPNSSDEEFLKFIRVVREKSKPIMIAANKIDIPEARKNVEKLMREYGNIVPCSAEAELALRRAAEKGLVKYVPGDCGFEIVGDLNEKQKEALDAIRQKAFWTGSTGVQDVIDKTVFNLLDMIVVYPVENEHKFSDKRDNVLPDALLMKRGSTALDLAYKVHEDIGKKFISAVDARTKKSVSADYKLKHNDIISIKAGR